MINLKKPKVPNPLHLIPLKNVSQHRVHLSTDVCHVVLLDLLEHILEKFEFTFYCDSKDNVINSVLHVTLLDFCELRRVKLVVRHYLLKVFEHVFDGPVRAVEIHFIVENGISLVLRFHLKAYGFVLR